MKVTYSKGYPSKTTIYNAWEEFDARMKLYISYSYSYNHSINWQDNYTQGKIDGFIKFLNDNGIRTGSFRDYESPTTGELKILPKI